MQQKKRLEVERAEIFQANDDLFAETERLNIEEAKWEKKGKWASLKAVFGRDVGIKWLSPFTKPNFKYFNSTFNKLLDV